MASIRLIASSHKNTSCAAARLGTRWTGPICTGRRATILLAHIPKAVANSNGPRRTAHWIHRGWAFCISTGRRQRSGGCNRGRVRRPSLFVRGYGH